MHIKIRNIYCTASGNKLEMAWLYDILLAEETVFSPYEKTKHKTKQYPFLQDGQFRTGLLPFVLRKAGDDLEFTFSDLRPSYDAVMRLQQIPTELPDPKKGGITLREDQLIGARALVEMQRGIIELPPGAGKTELAIAALMAMDREEMFAIFVHTEALHEQWHDRLVSRGIPLSDIGSITKSVWDERRITVVMSPTIASRLDMPGTLDFLSNLTGFIADECHISANDQNEKILTETPSARFRWGLSATALDYGVPRNMKLIGLIGDPLHVIPIEDLIEQGEIADFVYHFIPCPIDQLCPPITPLEKDWRQHYDFFLHFNPIMRNLIVRISMLQSDPCLIIVNRVEHGKYLAETIPHSRFIHGQSADRERVLAQFRTGRIKTLISSPILDFGIDLPDLRYVILAGGMESPIRLIQRIGRGLRKKETNNLLHVYDFNFLDMPYLGEHSRSRINTMRERCPNLKISTVL